MAKLNTELHFVSPFRDLPFPDHENLSFHCTNGHPAFREVVYGQFRRALNSQLLARIVLRSSHYLRLAVARYTKELEEEIKRLDPDVILAVHQIAAVACGTIGSRTGYPVVADIHGAWGEELVASGIIKRHSLPFYQARQFEAEALKGVDSVVVVSEELKAYFVEQYQIPSDRITPIGPCMEPRVSEAKSVTDPSKLVFSGMLNYRERFDLLLRSLPYIMEGFPKTELYATRKGDQIRVMQRLARQLNIRPTYFYYNDPAEFYSFLKTCHIGLLASSNDPARLFAYPSKIWDYFSVGLPIVANDVGGWSRFIRDSGAGILTDDTPRGFAQGVVSLMEDPDLIFEMGQRGLEFIRTRMKPESLVKQFRRVLEHVAQNG